MRRLDAFGVKAARLKLSIRWVIMGQFKHISVTKAWEKLQDKSSPTLLVDIRDPQSYLQGHPVGAFNLTGQNIAQWLNNANFSLPVMVICYHGNSSQIMAKHLIEQGFADVYSIDGGFAAWLHSKLPTETVER